MKKLSKKQKLIGGIAIILVAVIIAIVITTSIIRNNNQVANEGYAATTANADSEVIANYIKKGITIGGVTGKLESLNTFDATATAEDIAEGKVAYARGERIVGTYVEPISNEDLQISASNVYYADINDDGTVDGVIFADLAVGGSGQYGTNGYGTYRIPKEDDLKSYYIKSENYTDDSFKKSGKVIAPIEGNDDRKNDRFYVMALEDINPGTGYCWYDDAYGKLDKIVNYSDNDFGQGRENTEYVNDKWTKGSWGAQNDGSYDDMWSAIQEEIVGGWFVPSKSEWAAFGAAFGITASNYDTFGLSYLYWCSSQNGMEYAYDAYFGSGYIGRNYVSYYHYVRLATTF